MQRWLITFFLLNLVWVVSAQEEGNIWYFGEGAGLDFSSGAPVELTDGAISTFEGCAVISDANGVLQFYTNGGGRQPAAGQSTGIIWNRDHEVMYDMQGVEGGGFSASQSSVIIPKPGQADAYYLFTMEEAEYDIDGPVPGQPQGRGLSYFEIDMTLNGGLGEVTVADQRVFVPAYENLAAALHENEQDYWIIANPANTQAFIVTPVTAAGVGTPLFYTPGPAGTASEDIKVSPDRTRLYSGGLVYDFNAATGEISNPVQLSAFSYGSFSPNSRYLYVWETTSPGAELIQFDLQAGDISASANSLGAAPPALPSQLQLAPDGQIYFLNNPVSQPDDFNLGRVACPNTPNAFLETEVLTLTSGTFFVGLPNFTDHLFALEDSVLVVDLGPDSLFVCGNDPLQLDATTAAATYQWSTGAVTPTLSVTEPGTYSVTVTRGCLEGTDEVEVLPAGGNVSLVISGDTLLCPGETLILSVAPDTLSSYLWSTGATGPTLSVDSPGTYFVTASDACGAASAPFTVSASDAPAELVLSGDGTLCPGGTAEIGVASTGWTSLVWSTGDTTPTISVTTAGEYSVTAVSDCVEEPLAGAWTVTALEAPAVQIEGPDTLCTGTPTELTAVVEHAESLVWSTGDTTPVIVVAAGDAYQVTVANACGEATAEQGITGISPPTVRIEGDSVACRETPPRLTVVTGPGDTWRWSTGEATPEILPTEAGLYSVQARNICGVATAMIGIDLLKCEDCVYIPNAFSPNNDGINDLFGAYPACPVAGFELRIFSRWGELVFETEDPNTFWDGTVRGRPAVPGVYVFALTFEQALLTRPVEITGEVHLLR